jgi:hypothetical protein
VSSNGDGTGTVHATGNYSVTPLKLKITPPEGKVYRIHSLMLVVEDNGGFNSGYYGNGIVVTNGISIKLRDELDNVVSDFTNGEPIKTTGLMAHFFDRLEYINYGTGDEVVRAIINFQESMGDFVELRYGESLEANFSDNFTGLIHHDLVAQGYILRSRP